MQINLDKKLFDDSEFVRVSVIRHVKKEVKTAYRDPLLLDLCRGISFTGKYEMPIVKPCTISVPSDSEIFSFHRAIPAKMANVFPHFYVSDDILERIWNHWREYEDKLRHFPAVISPDFSMFMDMLEPQRRYNCFRNKLLAARWQADGLVVIPSISWADRNSFGYAIDGWPKFSVIAINSTGLGNDKRSKRLWKEGYQYVLEQLHPILILRYGPKQPGEREDISIYYENDNKKSACYGR